MQKPCLMAAVCGVLSSLVTMSSQAAFVPVGLNPGDTYQLVFVTRDTRDGTSDAVNVYNDFVNNQAALNTALTGTDSGVTYSAIVSTGSGGTINTEAINNISVSGPVYNLAGELVANDSADLWDGSIIAAVRYDQFGQSTSQSVWTGTYADGTADGLFGYRYLGGQDPWVGRSDLGGAAAGVNWISAGFVPTDFEYSLYAISTVLTAPNPVPLPAAAWLFGSALLGVAAVKRRRV